LVKKIRWQEDIQDEPLRQLVASWFNEKDIEDEDLGTEAKLKWIEQITA